MLLFAILAMGVANAQLKPEIGVGMSKKQARSSINTLKKQIGWYEAYKNDWKLEEWDDAIVLSMLDGDFYMDLRFNGSNELSVMKVTMYFPSPKGMTPAQMIKRIGGILDPETVSDYGQPNKSTFTTAKWNNTIDTVTGRKMSLVMSMEPVGESVKIYSKQNLIR